MNGFSFIRELLAGPYYTRTNQPTNPWAGLTTLNSGSALVTVSTNVIKSGCIVRYGTMPSSVAVAAASGGNIVVSSIVDNTSFAFARATATAVPWDEVVMWEIVKTAR